MVISMVTPKCNNYNTRGVEEVYSTLTGLLDFKTPPNRGRLSGF